MWQARKNTPEKLVNNVVNLVSLPSVYTRLENILKDPNHTRDDIAEVVGVDPVLAMRTLRIVNSSYYALPKTVDNISIALNLIGEYDIRNMVLISSVVNSVSKLADNGFDIKTFWQHSIRCGITAKLLASTQASANPDLLFLGGLLHDIGQLVIYHNEPELANTIDWYISNEKKPRFQIEQSLLGFDHAIVGALLTESWALSDKLKEMIHHHHNPGVCRKNQLESKIISLADQLTHFLNSRNDISNSDFAQLPALTRKNLDELNIFNDELLEILTDSVQQSQTIEEIICDI